jgi:hypothetical protein
MSYTPANLLVFQAAFAGALAGMLNSNRSPSSDSASTYTDPVTVAGAFAQSFDTNWGTKAVTQLNIGMVQSMCSEAWNNRQPPAASPFLTTTTYDTLSDAIITAITRSETYFSAEGVTPNELWAGAFGSQSQAVCCIRARNVVPGAVADLTAFTVAGNDGITNVQGDTVLLVRQATAAQNGLYTVGAVAGGTAALTRVTAIPTGETILAGQIEVQIGVGTLFANSVWKNTNASGVLGTNDLLFFPRTVIQSLTLASGTTTITNVPILSATKTIIHATRKTASGTANTIMYATNGAATAGALGTASVEVFAVVAAGTINAADGSTLEIAITNF